MDVFQCRVDRDFICVQGDDAESYLQSQLSNQIQGMAARSAKWSLLLQPTGKIDAVLRVTRFEDTVFILDTDPGMGDAVVVRLNRFKIRVKASIEVVDWQCVSVRGNGARAAAESAVRIPSEGLIVEAGRGGTSVFGADEAVDLVGANVAFLDAIRVGDKTELDRARVACGWPKMGVDFATECVPAETGIVSECVSFTKGCYPGQELVERMDSRATTAPVTVRHLNDSGWSVGDAYSDTDGNAGVVTSVGGGKVLVRVKRG